MSAGGAFGGARGLQAKAPEKGVFPLDHFGECKKVPVSYNAYKYNISLMEFGSIYAGAGRVYGVLEGQQEHG